jgi:hypothetical protein
MWSIDYNRYKPNFDQVDVFGQNFGNIYMIKGWVEGALNLE